MAWSDSILAQRAGGELLVSDNAAPIRIDLDDILSASGPARLTLNFRIQPSDTPADRALIDELLGSSQHLSASRLALRLLELARPAIRSIIQSSDPAQNLNASAIQSLRDSLNRAAFACGFIINEPFVADLRPRRLNIPTPATTRPDIAPAFSLHLATSRNILNIPFNPTSHSLSITNTITNTIDDRLGSIRSLRVEPLAGTGVRYLVGARLGAMILGDRPSLYMLPTDASAHDPSDSSRGSRGINSLAIAGDRVFASHSARGIFSWSIDSDEPARLIEPIGGRHVQGVGSRVVWARGGSLLTLDTDHRIQTIADGAPVLSLSSTADAHHDALTAARTDGSIAIFDPVDGHILMSAHVGEIAGATPVFHHNASDLWALLRQDGSVELRPLNQTSSTRLRGFSGIRILRAAGGWIAGLSEDGNKVAIWRSDSPQDPWRIIEVPAITPTRAVDLTLSIPQHP